MIQKVSFRNFKAFRSLDLDLEPLTVLVGPNASGKTTLLQGLRLATGIAGGAEKRSANPAERTALGSYGLNAPIELGFSGVWERGAGTIQITYEGRREPRPWSVQWTPALPRSESVDEPVDGLFDRHFAASVAINSIPSRQRELLSSTSILQFEAQSLAKASYSEKPVPEMDGSGEGLASVLAYLKLSQDEVFGEIEQALRQIVPSVQRIRIERASIERTTFRTIALDDQRHRVPEKRKLWGDKVVLDMRGAKGVSADSAGEGTLMVLGLTML